MTFRKNIQKRECKNNTITTILLVLIFLLASKNVFVGIFTRAGFGIGMSVLQFRAPYNFMIFKFEYLRIFRYTL